MLGTIAMMGVEVTGMAGISMMVSEATAALIPAGASTATKVCYAAGTGLVSLAAERIAVREFEGYIDECKTMVKDIKTARNIKKAEKAAKKAVEQEALQKLAEEEAKKIAATAEKSK